MKIDVYVKADNPEKNRIGVYKKYNRVLREDSAGYYVKIKKRRVYVYYEEGGGHALVRYWS